MGLRAASETSAWALGAVSPTAEGVGALPLWVLHHTLTLGFQQGHVPSTLHSNTASRWASCFKVSVRVYS